MTDYLRTLPDLEDEALAAAFDQVSFWSARFGTLLFRHLELGPNLDILDLGCGTGFPLLEMAQVFGPSCRLVGVDVWHAGLRRAAAKRAAFGLDGVMLVRGDGARLPLGDARFDLVVSHLGLNNFADGAAVLRECARVARPGARLVLTSNVRGHFGAFYATFRAVLDELGLHEALAGLEADEAHRGTPDDIAARVRAAGFEVERCLVEPFAMRYLDGGAFLRHGLTRFGFLPAWRRLVGPADEARVFAALERALDARAAAAGELRLEVPRLYLEARRRPR